MSEDHVDLDPQQVSNGLAKWDQVAETLQTRWDDVNGRITGLLTPATFGGDEPGSNFQASFVDEGKAGTFHERGMETVTAVEETGQDVRKAAEASLAADDQQASEVGGVNVPGFNSGGGGGGGSSSGGGGGGGGGGGAMMSGGGGSSGTMMSGKVGEDVWMSGKSEGARTGEAVWLSGESELVGEGTGEAAWVPGSGEAGWTSDDTEAGYADTTGEAQFVQGTGEALLSGGEPTLSEGGAQPIAHGEDAIYTHQDETQMLPGSTGDAKSTNNGTIGQSVSDGPGETLRERIADRIPDRIVEQLPDGMAERIYEARGDYSVEGPAFSDVQGPGTVSEGVQVTGAQGEYLPSGDELTVENPR